MIAVLHTIAGIGWEPTIRGYLTVLLGSAVLMGSVWLLLTTNLGHRLGTLVATAGFFGWMVTMGFVWWIYGIGYAGSAPSWQVVEYVTSDTDLANSPTGDVADLASLSAETPRELVDDYCPGLVDAVAEVEAERVLQNDITLAPDIPAGLPAYCNEELGALLAVDIELIRFNEESANAGLDEDDPRFRSPDELEAVITRKTEEEVAKKAAVTLSALAAVAPNIIVDAEADGRLDFNGWNLRSTAEAGEAQAAASAWLTENSAVSGFGGAGEFVLLDAFQRGGKEALITRERPDPSIPTRVWHKIKTAVQILNPTEYAIVEVQRAIQKETLPGEPPPFAEADPNYAPQYVVMVRDLGDRRVPGALVTFGSLLIFAGVGLMLHRRDLLWQKRQAGEE